MTKQAYQIKQLREQLYQMEQKLAECESGYQGMLFLERCKRESAEERVRKETVKKIFTDMYKLVKAAEEHVVFVTLLDIRAIARRYGVEISKK